MFLPQSIWGIETSVDVQIGWLVVGKSVAFDLITNACLAKYDRRLKILKVKRSEIPSVKTSF